MRPAKLLIFANAKAGTLINLAAASAAIDRPLQILVALSESGRTLLFWNDPA